MKQHHTLSLAISHLHFIFFLNRFSDVKSSKESRWMEWKKERWKNKLKYTQSILHVWHFVTFFVAVFWSRDLRLHCVPHAFPSRCISFTRHTHSIKNLSFCTLLYTSFLILALELFFLRFLCFSVDAVAALFVCVCEPKSYTVFTVSASSLSYATGHLFYSISYECVNTKSWSISLSFRSHNWLCARARFCVFSRSFTRFCGWCWSISKDSVLQLRNGAVFNLIVYANAHVKRVFVCMCSGNW